MFNYVRDILSTTKSKEMASTTCRKPTIDSTFKLLAPS